MKVYRPLRTDFIGQRFGENLACAETDLYGNVKRPFKILPGTFPGTCPPRSTKFYPSIGLKGHNGSDVGIYYGEPGKNDARDFPAMTGSGVYCSYSDLYPRSAKAVAPAGATPPTMSDTIWRAVSTFPSAS